MNTTDINEDCSGALKRMRSLLDMASRRDCSLPTDHALCGLRQVGRHALPLTKGEVGNSQRQGSGIAEKPTLRETILSPDVVATPSRCTDRMSLHMGIEPSFAALAVDQVARVRQLAVDRVARVRQQAARGAWLACVCGTIIDMVCTKHESGVRAHMVSLPTRLGRVSVAGVANAP